ncbi:MAG: hypothetical protein GXP62_16190 [Oligoflexia bacterium]|nr:hypothetical protein [Oligoflexia bacterium]
MVLSLMKTLWRRWKGLAHLLVKAQSWILMAVVYVFAMGPISIFIKLDKRRRLDRGPPPPGAETYQCAVPPISSGAGTSDVGRAQRPW